MTAITVKPNAEVQGVRFGTKREVVREAFGSNYREFKKSIFSKNTTDDYGSFHLFYDKDDRMVAVEFFEGEVIVRGKTVLPAKLSAVRSVIKNLHEDEGGYVSYDESVGVSVNGDEVESILFGCKNYYG